MDSRSYDRLLHHYAVEKELADRLRSSTDGSRGRLYAEVYNELFRRVPDHAQNLRKASSEPGDLAVAHQFALTRRLLAPGMTYLEVGCGDCAHAIMVAGRVARVYAIDVSDLIASRADLPANLELIISDGTSIAVPPASVDLAYSHQLMEHLHADDAEEQLRQIYDALRPGGMYLCITPNALCGPHDISFFFDDEPRGLHLREYSIGDLADICRRVGFTSFKCLISYGRLSFPARLPIWPFVASEALLRTLPRKMRQRLARPLLAVKFIALK